MCLHQLLFLSVTAFALISTLAYGATLPRNEVQALKDIAITLGQRNWNFSVDPCSEKEGWVAIPEKNAVTCNCSFSNGTVCHVVRIILKELNLTGILPLELTGLPFLQDIDLSLNYLHGAIPPEWASLPLINMSLAGNRLTGEIPKALASISTLANLSVEFNQFSGELPKELGNLFNLEKFHISSNNFSGELPETFVKLTKLNHVRISDNHFTGQIPNFIQNWTMLERLVIQASGLVGPIPSGIAFLENLIELRITDLNGPEETFPPLPKTKMKYLTLRTCNITGEVPQYIGQMTNLRQLDLSFNNLRGEIPNNFSGLINNLNYLYLTGNLLTGTIPDWMFPSGAEIDLSYNNFTAESSDSSRCERGRVNFFASSSKGSNATGIVSCLRSLTCPMYYSQLHINCGGNQVTVNGTTKFEEDREPAGASSFVIGGINHWAFSSTGFFTDDHRAQDIYIQENKTRLLMNDFQLYKEARLSPISLTYYGFCLVNGNYTVNLHFAEILFTDDKTYSSLGRRIFDVYIQGKLVLKDFNIEDEAGGVGKAIVKNFPAVVTNNTMEIRLYWAGRGTTAIPDGGFYGPLISAISLYNPVNGSSNGAKVGTVLGVVAAAAFIVIVIVSILWWKGCLRTKRTSEQGLGVGILGKNSSFLSAVCCRKATKSDKDLETFIRNYGPLSIKRYNFSDVKKMTNSFKDKLGQGGFGDVYKGKLLDGRFVAVKLLNSSKGDGQDFINEVASISRTSHVNVVTLLGFCLEGNKSVLIFEFLPNGSLEKFINNGDISKPSNHQPLEWKKMYEIVIGVSKGLEYLHRGCNTRILHFDIKPHNILLDEDFCPKISDFGMAKLCHKKDSIVSSMVGARGTIGYIAPEVFSRNFGEVSHKSDVYSFGMMILELVGCKDNINVRADYSSEIYFPHWIYKQFEIGKQFKLPGVITSEESEIVKKMIIVGLWCVQTRPSDRPPMNKVIEMLQGSIEALQIPPNPSDYSPPRPPIDSSSMSTTTEF